MDRVIATVLKVNGTVFVRSEDGSTRALKPGDKIYEGEILITKDGGSVELQMLDGSIVPVGENREIRMIGQFVDQAKESREEAESDDVSRDDPFASEESRKAEENIEYPYVQHGYIRVEKGEAPPDSPDYRFVSINSSYDSSLEGRAADADPLMEGRATHDPRLLLSPVPPDRQEQEEIVQVLRAFEGGDRFIVTDTKPEIGNPENAVVDEDDLVPDGSDQSEAPIDGGSLAVISGDEPVDTFFDGNNPPAGLRSGGEEVKYYVPPDGHTLIGYTGDLPPSGIPDEGQQVFKVVINNPDSQAGEQSYTYTQLDQLDHPPADGENQLALTFNYTVKDASGDSVSSSFNVTVVDDIPVAEDGEVSGYVDEDELPEGITDNDAEDTLWDSTSLTAEGSGKLGDMFTFGADQPGKIAFKSNIENEPVRTTGGEDVYSQDRQVFYDYESDTVIYGRTEGGDAIFKIEITNQETGDYTFTLLDQLDHPNGNGDDNEVMELNLTGAVQAYDYDMDPVDAAGVFIMKVEDDIPELARDAAGNPLRVTGEVHEDALTTVGNEDLSEGNEEGAGQVKYIA
ncbi:MAG: retention module-containing protein, partial [Chlorobiales bacterium]|nr:retention module-containing protein [Chlorobiales bacterium]